MIYGQRPAIGPVEVGAAALGLIIGLAANLTIGTLLIGVGLVVLAWKLLNAAGPALRQVGLFAGAMTLAALIMLIVGAGDGALVVAALSFVASLAIYAVTDRPAPRR